MKEPFVVQRAADIVVDEQRQPWLVRSLWGNGAVGIVGGAPKSCKTWFALDLAISVASGTPCLGHFEVEQTGPALAFIAEDPAIDVRARLEALARARGIDFDTLDVQLIIEPVVRLDLPEHQERLRATIASVGPRILVLDPLVRLHRLDENSARDVSGLLGYLRELQREFECALLLVHHTSKKQRSRPGQALRGSSDLHAFGDSNAYITKTRKGIELVLEHRSAPAPEPIHLRLVEPGPHLAIVDAPDPPAPDLDERILAALAEGPATRRDLRARLRVNNNRLGEVLQELLQAGRLRRESQGWAVVEQPPQAAVGAGAPQDDDAEGTGPEHGGHPWEPEDEQEPQAPLFATT